MADPNPFTIELEDLRKEVGPILRHVIVTLTLLLGSFLVALTIVFFRETIPSHEKELDFVMQVDIWLMVAIGCIFALYMFLTLVVRLGKSLRRELA